MTLRSRSRSRMAVSQGASAAAHSLSLAALEHRQSIVADDHLTVLQVALIGQVGHLRQSRLQLVDESNRVCRQAQLLAVILHQRFALFRRQQLVAVIGIGFRPAYGHVAQLEFVGEHGEHAHLKQAAVDALLARFGSMHHGLTPGMVGER